MDNKTIGLLISTRRKEKGLTQKALAEQLNVTDKAVSKWERDIARPDINTIPKLAEILDLSLEELMNLPVKPKVEPSPEAETMPMDPVVQVEATTTTPDPSEVERQKYKEKSKQLLLKGIIGFAIGFLFALFTSPEFGFFGFCAIGIFMAGLPYGWELSGRIIGGWVVVGHIAIMLIAFMLRFVIAMLSGWITYPIALTYNLMKSQKQGSKGRRILTVVLVLAIALVVAFLLLATQPWA